MEPETIAVADSGGDSGRSAEALQRLLAGNRRYVEERSAHPHQGARRRVGLRRGQHPVAAVLGCSDSRVSPELLFDQGLGDLFVVRVAGHVPGSSVLASLEYAAMHLNVPLIVVLGHTGCGAVGAAVAGQGDEGANLGRLVAALKPAVAAAAGRAGDVLSNAIVANVRLTVAAVTADTGLAENVACGKLRVVGALYDLESGVVSLVEPEAYGA